MRAPSSATQEEGLTFSGPMPKSAPVVALRKTAAPTMKNPRLAPALFEARGCPAPLFLTRRTYPIRTALFHGDLERYLRVVCGNNRDALVLVSHPNNKSHPTRKEKKRPTGWTTFFRPFSNNSNQESIGTGHRPAFASLPANTRL